MNHGRYLLNEYKISSVPYAAFAATMCSLAAARVAFEFIGEQGWLTFTLITTLFLDPVRLHVVYKHQL